MAWSIAGVALSCIVVAAALYKSTGRTSTYYEREVYGMTARSHRAYAALSAAFAAAFAVSFFVTGLPVIPLLGAQVLVFIFYFSSFARGFSDEE